MIDANGGDISDWSRIGGDVLPVGTPGQPGYFPGGYEATADVNVARIWVTQYGLDAAGPIKRQRDAYVAQQQFGVKEYVARQAALVKLIADNSGGGGVAPVIPTKEDIATEVIRQMKLPGN
jgi:hypothetical protein